MSFVTKKWSYFINNIPNILFSEGKAKIPLKNMRKYEFFTTQVRLLFKASGAEYRRP